MTTTPDNPVIPELIRRIARLEDRVGQVSEVVIEGDRLADGIAALSRNVALLTNVTERIEETARRVQVVEDDVKKNKNVAENAEMIATDARRHTARRFVTVAAVLLALVLAGVVGAVWLTRTRDLIVQQCEERQASLHVTIVREEQLALTNDPPATRTAHAQSAKSYRALLKDCR